MIALALLVPLALGANDTSLSMSTGEGHVPVPCTPEQDRSFALLPLVSRSEVSLRLHASRGRASFQLLGDDPKLAPSAVKLWWIEHDPGERVLRLAEPAAGDSPEFILVGAPSLPAKASASGRNALPWLARQDGLTLRSGLLRVSAPVLTAENRDTPLSLFSIGGRGPVCRLLAANGSGIALDLKDEGPIDQLFFARAKHISVAQPETGSGPSFSRLDASPTAADSRRGGFSVRIPGVARGRTGTLLVELFGTVREKSPALAGGEPPTGFLRDVTAEMGIDFVHMEGPDEQLDIRPTMGPGTSLGDVDGDSFVDIYLVQGCGREGSSPPRNRLYKNLAGTGFEDRTEQSGTGDTGCGMGALFFDGEGDGDLDLYVANYGPDVLFENDGNGVFLRHGKDIGIEADGWSAAICAGDVDLDGDLDLYITSYLDYDESKMPAPEELSRYQREDPIAMLPFAFPGAGNVFFENISQQREAGSGSETASDRLTSSLRFRDRTNKLGLADEQGRSMQAVFWDFDRDGDVDLYVANDVSFNVLFRNDREAGFKDISFATGMDDPRGGMGIAIGDIDRDGDGDLVLTNWQLETNALYVNNLFSNSPRHRVGTFRDRTVQSRLGPPGIGVTSWGVALFDAENDGDLDLFIANGYTSPDYESTGICVGQPNHYFENDGGGRFRLANDRAGSALDRRLASRCVAACDFDQDGRMDLLVTANNGPTLLLHNHAESGHWLGVRLHQPRANPFAIGAEVTIETDTGPARQVLFAGTSYLAGNPPELLFGLGDSAPEKLTVRWPGGESTRHPVTALDRWIVIRRN